jgi:hypothetical protein
MVSVTPWLVHVLRRAAVLMESGARALRLRCVRIQWKPRSDDVYVVSYPRSGTTWVQMILYQLTTDGEVTFGHVAEVIPYLERAIDLQRDCDQLPSPRIFKSHFKYKEMKRWPGKYIYVVRDGEDVMVSYFHFYNTHLRGRCRPLLAYDEFVERFLSGRLECGSWFRHVAEWIAAGDRPSILVVRYEELTKDLECVIKKIAAFCGFAIAPRDMPGILERCSFSFMKRHETKFDHMTEVLWERNFLPGSFIRQGSSGTGKVRLTEEQQAKFNLLYRRYLANVQVR